MPPPPMDADKLSAAHKKITAIDGISEQGAVPDPEVMNTLLLLLL